MRDPAWSRERMVAAQIEARGIRSGAVLNAMRTVPRERFVPPDMIEHAYEDAALPIAHGQTISQPYVVALMTEVLSLREDARVLEIGSGFGYAAAVLSRIAREVITVERIPELATETRTRLAELGYDNVRVINADGTLGYAPSSPYGGISVTAGGPAVPTPLRDQLAVGGRLVIPIGGQRTSQRLVLVTRRSEDAYDEEDLGPVAFVPLIGREGWS